MCQGYLGRVSEALLRMVTRNRDICSLKPPPIRETFTVVQPREASSLALQPTIDLPVVSNRDIDLQSMTTDFKVILHVVKATGIIFVLHPMPISALLVPLFRVFPHVSTQIDGRLTVPSAVALFTILRAPPTVVCLVVDVPLVIRRI